MATTVTSNYAGEVAAGYVAATILAGNTLANRQVTIHEGIKFKRDLQVASLTNSIQADACDFTAAGSTAIDPVTLQPVKLMVNMEDCKLNWLQTWESEKMRAGRNGEEIPAEFLDWLIGYLGEDVSSSMQGNLWTGNVTGSGFTDFDGFEKRLLDSASSVKIDAVAGGITSANVLAEIQKVYDAVPDEVINSPELKIFISNKVARAYKQAIGAGDYLNQGVVGDKPLNYLGVELIPTNRMTADAMVAAEAKNLHFGTDLTGDMEEVQVIDRQPIDGSKNVRFVMRFSGGTAITNDAEIVLYHPDVTP